MVLHIYSQIIHTYGIICTRRANTLEKDYFMKEMKSYDDKANSFNEFRFGGLNFETLEDKSLTMDRVSEDESRVVIRMHEDHLFVSKFGFGLYLDTTNGVWLKKWQASVNKDKTEVMLSKDFFKVTQFPVDDDLTENGEIKTWDDVLALARKQQDEGLKVTWKDPKMPKNKEAKS